MIRTVCVMTFYLLLAGCSSAPTTQPTFIDGPNTQYSKTYKLNIEHDCPEGCVACDKVRMILYNNITKEVSVYTGSTCHTKGSDGSPSRFLGYIFKANDKTYRIIENQNLQIIVDEKIVLQEQLR